MSLPPQPEPDVPPEPGTPPAAEIPSRAGTASTVRRSAHAGPGTREIVLGWCLWLIGGWGMILAGGGSVPGSGPVHQWMSLMALVGLCAVWPAVRLSEEARDAWGRPSDAGLSRRVILVDWLALQLVFQAVLWPMAFVGRWSVEQALLLGGTLAAWSLLAGLITAWGRVSATASARAAAMAGCLAVLLLEPLVLFVAAAASGGGWANLPDLRLSPLQAAWAYSGSPARFPFADPAFAHRVIGVFLASVLGWAHLPLRRPPGGPSPVSVADPATAAFRFCGGCGVPAPRVDHTALACDACGWCFFTNVAAAAAVLLEIAPAADEPAGPVKLLLVRRSREPGRGKLGIPGGFVDPGESAEAAARRELREELRLELPPAPLRFLCTAANAYPYRGVLYRTLDTVFTAPLPAPPAWFDEAEIGALVPIDRFAVADADLAFPATRTALAAWRASKRR